MRVLIGLLVSLWLAAPTAAQLYDVEEQRATYLAACEAGDRYACGYAIALYQREDAQSWLTERNVALHIRACTLGLDGSCWKFERRMEPNPYAPVRADPERFFPMVMSGCDNGSTMACWQAGTELLALGREDEALDRAGRSCAGGYSDGCALQADIEASRGLDTRHALAEACYGARPGYAPKASYCEQACEQGDGRACYSRGNIYEWGRDGYQPSARNARRASSFYERACELGYELACGR